jgi:hypothetical protein
MAPISPYLIRRAERRARAQASMVWFAALMFATVYLLTLISG